VTNVGGTINAQACTLRHLFGQEKADPIEDKSYRVSNGDDLKANSSRFFIFNLAAPEKGGDYIHRFVVLNN
jgi:hypothetical protein